MAAPNSTSTTMIRTDGYNTVDGHQLGQSSTDPIGFYGATPVNQPVSASQTHTPSAGVTTAVYVNTTWDGGISGTQYAVGDIVRALKLLGLIA